MKKSRLKLLIAILFIGLALAAIDVSRQPENQLSARLYIGFVHIYQAVGRPMLEGVIACRYRPTCSDYSIQAVERFGVVRGLVLTFNRINSCQTDVPMGTSDPIPEL